MKIHVFSSIKPLPQVIHSPDAAVHSEQTLQTKTWQIVRERELTFQGFNGYATFSSIAKLIFKK